MRRPLSRSLLAGSVMLALSACVSWVGSVYSGAYSVCFQSICKQGIVHYANPAPMATQTPAPTRSLPTAFPTNAASPGPTYSAEARARQEQVDAKLFGERPSETAATYQAFEHGFMIHILDLGCVMSFSADDPYGAIFPQNARRPSSYSYCVHDQAFPIIIADVPAPERAMPTVPIGVLGSIWSNNQNIKDSLGDAVLPAVDYVGKIPRLSGPTYQGGHFSYPVITLPDGKELWCGAMGAMAGVCQTR